MSLSGLDNEKVYQRGGASEGAWPKRGLGAAVGAGAIRFTLLSLGVFATWAFGGRFLYGNLGELGAYAVWCLLFLGGAGMLKGVLIGPVSWGGFYGMFLPGFLAYSVIWTVAWMMARNTLGEILGAVLGMGGMAAVCCVAFGSFAGFGRVFLPLALGNVVGYFAGSWCHANTGAPWAQLLWGLWYGVGTGCGLGAAFYALQAPLRAAIERGPTSELSESGAG